MRSLGKNVFAYKMQALVIGGVIGALGGFVFALGRRRSSRTRTAPSSRSSRTRSLILGGAARVFGPVVGSMIFWVLLVFIDSSCSEASDTEVIPELAHDHHAGRRRPLHPRRPRPDAAVIFRPQGIFGDKREVMLDAR